MKIQIFIFGAGKNGKFLLNYLKGIGTIKVSAFIDNDPNRQNERIQGIECISPNEAIKRGVQQEIVCVSVFQKEKRLRNS